MCRDHRESSIPEPRTISCPGAWTARRSSLTIAIDTVFFPSWATSSPKENCHYRAFVEAGRDEPPVSPFERAKAGFVLGGEAFVENIRKLLGEASHRDSEATLRALSRTLAHPSVPEVQDAVRSVFGDRSDCQKRRLEMFALRLFTGLPVRDVGSAVGVTASAVSKAHKAIRVQLAKDSELERRLRLLAGRFQSATAQVSAPPHDEAPALIRRGVPGTIHG